MFDLFGGDVTDLDAATALGVAAELRAGADRCEARLLQVAAQIADLHPEPEIFRDDSRWLPGMERTKVYGGDGCPEVAEFAPIDLGTVLGITSRAAANLIGDALALRHRLPRLWARVLAGEVQAWRAREIAHACWPLSAAAAALVDERVAGIAQSLTSHRLGKVVKAAVKDADPDQARDDADQEKKERGVWVGQSDAHGTKSIFVKAAAGDVIRFDATTDQVADLLGQLGDTDSKDLRRAKAIGWLASPHALLELWNAAQEKASQENRADADHRADCEADQTPTRGSGDPDDSIGLPGAGGLGGRYTLYVHLTDRTLASRSGIVRVGESRITQRAGGIGPLLASQLAELLGDARLIDKIIVKPVIDLADRISVDAYEIPDRIREHVLLRYLTCIFPYCNCPATHSIDLDHVVPYDDTGPPDQTSTENLAPGCRLHHRLKTHGGWTVRRLADGAFEWTGPHHHRYRVDHTGTHPITGPVSDAA